MKLLKIFGIVVGLHGAALVLIFANPGCNSTRGTGSSRSTAATQGAGDTPVVSVPYIVAEGATTAPATDPASTQINAFGGPELAAPPPLFSGEPASAADSAGRARPTRPNTPVGAALGAGPVADVTPVTTYTVVRGDSLWLIAKRNKLTVAELAAANKLAPNAALQIGRKLIIPSQSAASPTGSTTGTPATAAASAAPAKAAPEKNAAPASRPSLTHVVRSGETLGGIARRYQVRVGDIALANNISDPAKIRLGQTLVIPGGRVSATVSSPRPAAKAPAPATPRPAAAPAPRAAQIESTPALPIDAAPAAEAPPIDRPLDEGFGIEGAPADVPVIDVEG